MKNYQRVHEQLVVIKPTLKQLRLIIKVLKDRYLGRYDYSLLFPLICIINKKTSTSSMNYISIIKKQ